MNSHLALRIASFCVVNLRNSLLLRAIQRLESGYSEHNLRHPELIRDSLDNRTGTYLLELTVKRPHSISIGKLAQHTFKVGRYVYIGSAFGPGGLQARVRHHCKLTQRPHWHIDYLRKAAVLNAVCFSTDQVRHEHVWANAIMAAATVHIPVKKFGSSDCQCRSHLFFLSDDNNFSAFKILQPKCTHIERIESSQLPVV